MQLGAFFMVECIRPVLDPCSFERPLYSLGTCQAVSGARYS